MYRVKAAGELFIDELPEIEEEAIITGCPDLAVSLDEI